MVPVLVIRTKGMIAISSSGTLLPNSVSEKTSLGFGQSTVVDMRTVMYEMRKLPKMKVSLSRKIHIIGLPQGTFLNARWSEDTSATALRHPPAAGNTPTVSLFWCTIICVSSLARSQGRGRTDPHPERVENQQRV